MDQPPFAEYPRPSMTPGYHGRGPGVYFDAIGESWTIVRQDLGTWMAASLVAFLLSMVVVLPALPYYLGAINAMQGAPDSAAIVTFFVSYTLIVVLSSVSQQFFLAGMIGMAVRKLRGEPIVMGMLFEPFRNFGRMLGACALFSVCTFAATLACLLPVFFFGPVLLLMPTVALIRGTSATESLSLTWEACKPHWAGILGLGIIMYLIVTVSVYVCCVPVLITFPMLAVVFGIHYRAFFESSAGPMA